MHSAKLFLLIDFKRRNLRTLGKEGWHGKSKHTNSTKDLPSLKFSELHLAVEAKNFDPVYCGSQCVEAIFQASIL